MCPQDEHDDEDDWTPSKAAGVCMMLIASCIGNDIINPPAIGENVMPTPLIPQFISENIGNADWRFRDAAVFTLGERGGEALVLCVVLDGEVYVFVESL